MSLPQRDEHGRFLPAPDQLVPIRSRGREEPLGRWMDRCLYTAPIAIFQVMFCDRKAGHAGRHQGRFYDVNARRHLGWMVMP